MGTYMEQNVKRSSHPEEAAGAGKHLYGDKLLFTPEL